MEKRLGKVENGLTEKGNLKAKVREGMKDLVEAKYFEDFEVTPKGELVLPIAEVDGVTAYARVNLSISVADNLFDEPKGKAKAEDSAPVNLDGLLD